MRRDVRNGGKQKTQQQNKTRRLRTDREERRRRGRRALINVRRPHRKRKRGNLETQSDENEQHAKQEQFVARKISRDLREFGEIEFARRSPNQRDAVNHERRRQRTEDEILH